MSAPVGKKWFGVLNKYTFFSILDGNTGCLPYVFIRNKNFQSAGVRLAWQREINKVNLYKVGLNYKKRHLHSNINFKYTYIL